MQSWGQFYCTEPSVRNPRAIYKKSYKKGFFTLSLAYLDIALWDSGYKKEWKDGVKVHQRIFRFLDVNLLLFYYCIVHCDFMDGRS